MLQRYLNDASDAHDSYVEGQMVREEERSPRGMSQTERKTQQQNFSRTEKYRQEHTDGHTTDTENKTEDREKHGKRRNILDEAELGRVKRQILVEEVREESKDHD